ncbi:MAG: glycosyltransferase [Pseudomonadota bacterium]
MSRVFDSDPQASRAALVDYRELCVIDPVFASGVAGGAARRSEGQAPSAAVVAPVGPNDEGVDAFLDALLDQTYAAFELVVVDRGATASARASLAARANDPRLRVVAALGAGPDRARSVGVGAAKAEFVGFCEPDALWRPGALAAHIRHLSERPSLGVSLSRSERTEPGARPRPLRRVTPYGRLGPVELLALPTDALGSTAVARRAALEPLADARGVFRGPTGAEAERDAWLRMAQSGAYEVGSIPAALTIREGLAPAIEPAAARRAGAASPARVRLGEMVGAGAAALARAFAG